MTPLQCIAAISMLAVTACNNNRKQENPGQETPKALEDKAASYEIISKRGDDNLVDELYRELLKKDVDLKRLEENIGRLYDTKDDSTNSFARYQQKNMSYFASANMLVAGMKDSVLRDSIKLLVADQMKKYTARIAKQNELLKDIDAKQMTLEDLHSVLKIVRTLPVIDQFRRERLPATSPLEGFIKQQEQAIGAC